MSGKKIIVGLREALTYAKLEAENEKLRAALREALLQIDYLHDKFRGTGSGEAVLARIRSVLSDHQTEDRHD